MIYQPQAEVSHYLPQYLFVCDEDGNIMVDYVAKYEEGLENGLEIVLSKLNYIIDEPIKLPKSNVTKNQRRHYSTYYNQSTRNIVANLYKRDFEIFNYSTDLPLNHK